MFSLLPPKDPRRQRSKSHGDSSRTKTSQSTDTEAKPSKQRPVWVRSKSGQPKNRKIKGLSSATHQPREDKIDTEYAHSGDERGYRESNPTEPPPIHADPTTPTDPSSSYTDNNPSVPPTIPVITLPTMHAEDLNNSDAESHDESGRYSNRPLHLDTSYMARPYAHEHATRSEYATPSPVNPGYHLGPSLQSSRACSGTTTPVGDPPIPRMPPVQPSPRPYLNTVYGPPSSATPVRPHALDFEIIDSTGRLRGDRGHFNDELASPRHSGENVTSHATSHPRTAYTEQPSQGRGGSRCSTPRGSFSQRPRPQLRTPVHSLAASRAPSHSRKQPGLATTAFAGSHEPSSGSTEDQTEQSGLKRKSRFSDLGHGFRMFETVNGRSVTTPPKDFEVSYAKVRPCDDLGLEYEVTTRYSLKQPESTQESADDSTGELGQDFEATTLMEAAKGSNDDSVNVFADKASATARPHQGFTADFERTLFHTSPSDEEESSE